MRSTVSEELFGTTSFPDQVREGEWYIFRKTDAVAARVWHGTTLHQLREILATGYWRPGLWITPTATSPAAVWVTTSRAISMDRASLNRGWACSSDNDLAPTIPDGWDYPVSVGMALPINSCGLHRQYRNGHQCRRYLSGGRHQIPLEELMIQEVAFHLPTYQRYGRLKDDYYYY